jgi:hypothetical protein
MPYNEETPIKALLGVVHILDDNLHFFEEKIIIRLYMRVVRKIRVPMIFHNEKHVYWR